ncbi:TPA: korC [Klebsiella quasipneumoniae]|nr:korC [Klebsiella quasipneumoniae]
MNTDNKQYIRELIEAGEFNGYTLVSGENWKPPTVDDIAVVRGLIPLTDIRLANRLDVDERTIRKWKTGQTRMVFTTWWLC